MKILAILLMISQLCFSQSPKPFKTCIKTVAYTVDDLVFRKKVGMDLTIPLSNSQFRGGVEQLKKYFLANSFPDYNEFRTFISFVVNCKGEVGDFNIMSDGRGAAVEKVFEIVKKMPKRWKPAISKDGKPVDSYQIIYCTLSQGKFTSIYYK